MDTTVKNTQSMQAAGHLIASKSQGRGLKQLQAIGYQKRTASRQEAAIGYHRRRGLNVYLPLDIVREEVNAK